MRSHKGALAIVLLTVVLASALSIAIPWPTKILVDDVLGHAPLPSVLRDIFEFLPGDESDRTLLLYVALASFVIFGLSIVLETAYLVVSVRLGQRMTYALSADVFGHLQRLSLRYHGRRPVGDTLQRATTDTFAVKTLVSEVAVPVIHAVVLLAMMFSVMLALSPGMTLLAVLVVPLQLLTIVVFGPVLRRRSRARLDLEGRMLSLVEQSLSSVPIVQAFTREDVEHARFREFADRTVVAHVREAIAQQWFRFAVGAVTAAGTAGVLYLGGRYALHGSVTAGTIIVFLAYLVGLYGPLNQIAEMASTYQVAGAQADRIAEILDTAPDVVERPGARPLSGVRGHVVYDAVSFSYEPGQPVLHEVSLEARVGEVVAIVGPNGAGKSTLVSLLLRFFDPDCGRVTIDGHDLRDLRLRSLREHVAIVFQEPFILPLSVAENIAYGRPGASSREIATAARAANADGFVARLPDGYDTVVGDRGSTLSGGEQQQLAIARAFLRDAPILVLDEPTSALDARTEGALLDALTRLRAGRTCFVIAHRLSTIRNADRILVLDHGAIVESGSHDELMAASKLYATLYSSQMDRAQHVTPTDTAT